MRILLIEDQLSLRTSLQRSLDRMGFEVAYCDDGAKAIAKWRSYLPHMVLLDLSLPNVDGLQILRQARQEGWDTPVLILTARGTVGDKILGLNAGADDYMPKPFDLDELEARLRAMARRLDKDQALLAQLGTMKSLQTRVSLGALSMDKQSGAIYLHDEVLQLPPRELKLLQALLTHAGQALSKEQLLDTVFPNDADVQPEAIEVVAYRLRKRIQGASVELVTLRGLGYLLKPSEG